jgi:elongation factor P
VVLASELKAGAVLQIEGRLHKVLEVIRHAGSGQMHGFIEVKLKDMKFNHLSDKHFKPADKLNEVEVLKKQIDFLYSDAEMCYFMDPESFEQVGVLKNTVGTIEKFLKEGSRATIEIVNEEAVSVQFPKVLELEIVSTGPGIREGQDNTLKSAMLENGIEIMVPQFIVEGDIVRVDTEKVKYVDRVTTKRI